ncbi:MAG: MATE family efflux transporter [Tissierellia bacterium]|nr:MATE family efflux transporter [Tissierellia bacterium]
MNRNLDLTEGKITSTLVKLALPIMGTSFIQMAYSLTDTMWLGRYSTQAVAAVGTAGNLLWFGYGLILITQVGLGVSVAHAYGRKDMEEAKRYISNGFKLDILIAIFYSLFLVFFRKEIIGFFNLNQREVIEMAQTYLLIVGMGVIFQFLNPVFSTIFNSGGNSVTPFKLNTIGLVANMILDPVLIFGIGPIPSMGAAGAAIATTFSQALVTIIFIYIGKKNKEIYTRVKFFTKPDLYCIKRIIKLGLPPFVQTAIHSSINMVLTRFIANFGDVAVAVLNIGTQIESITWLSAEGFGSAISAFIGQNFGAKKTNRIKQGYKKGIQILGTIGFFSSLLLIVGARSLFRIFTPDDPVAIREGIHYLRILGLSQFFMATEIGTAGAFNGLGKTVPPTLIGVIFNLLRIPMALVLSSTNLGLLGIWWAISLSSMIKGTVSPLIYYHMINNKLCHLVENN